MATPAISRPLLDGALPHGSGAAVADQPPALQRIAGRYRYDRHGGGWWWSPEMFTLHGLPVTSTPPATEEYLRHQHVEDQTRVLDAIAQACIDGRPIAMETRIVRADGQERALVLVGEPLLDASGEVTAIEGIAVDITEGRPPGAGTERTHALEAEVEQMRTAMASRAAIEQAKGILMLLTNCGDQVAFDLLAHISSHTHRKVRDVAEVITGSVAGRIRLPEDIRAIIRDACPPSPPPG